MSASDRPGSLTPLARLGFSRLDRRRSTPRGAVRAGRSAARRAAGRSRARGRPRRGAAGADPPGTPRRRARARAHADDPAPGGRCGRCWAHRPVSASSSSGIRPKLDQLADAGERLPTPEELRTELLESIGARRRIRRGRRRERLGRAPRPLPSNARADRGVRPAEPLAGRRDRGGVGTAGGCRGRGAGGIPRGRPHPCVGRRGRSRPLSARAGGADQARDHRDGQDRARAS